MFDIGWGELLVIGVVALIAIGPKELPAVLRTVGQWMGKVRRMASEFQSQFQEAMREAEMADLKKQVEEMSAAAVRKFEEPIETARKDVEDAMVDKPASSAAPVEPGASAPQSVPESAADTTPQQTDAAAPPQTDAAAPPPPAPTKAGEGA